MQNGSMHSLEILNLEKQHPGMIDQLIDYAIVESIQFWNSDIADNISSSDIRRR